jgi:hypothetical protein
MKNQMKNQDEMWDQLIDLRAELEINETENEEALEEIFFLLDSMRGGHDVTEQVETFLEINAQ